MNDVRDAARGRAVEIVCGLVMILVGVWLTAASSTSVPPNQLGIGAGGLLTALGGVLMSWVVAFAVSKREAVKQLNEQFDAVSRNLGQAATRVSRAVEQCQAQELDSTTTLALISQATTLIYGQIDQIQRLIGARFDSEAIMQTFKELDQLATKLDREPRAASEEVRGEVARILQRVRRGTQPVAKKVEVECPYCEVSYPVSLGTDSGATSTVTCLSCTGRFNVHRSSGGEAFTRPIGRIEATTPALDLAKSAAAEVRPVAVERTSAPCAECGKPLEIMRKGIDTPRLMICTACFRSNFVTPMSLQVVKGEKFERSVGIIVGRAGSQAYVNCPKCGKSIRTILNNGHSRFGFCSEDRQIVEVTHAAFDLWREGLTSGIPA